MGAYGPQYRPKKKPKLDTIKRWTTAHEASNEAARRPERIFGEGDLLALVPTEIESTAVALGMPVQGEAERRWMLTRDRDIILALREAVLPKSLNNIKQRVFERHMLRGAKKLKPHLNALRTMMALSAAEGPNMRDFSDATAAAVRGWLKK